MFFVRLIFFRVLQKVTNCNKGSLILSVSLLKLRSISSIVVFSMQFKKYTRFLSFKLLPFNFMVFSFLAPFDIMLPSTKRWSSVRFEKPKSRFLTWSFYNCIIIGPFSLESICFYRNEIFPLFYLEIDLLCDFYLVLLWGDTFTFLVLFDFFLFEKGCV